ncbi:MAG: N-6 DNA methylase [Fibrobacteres bacterium]|nr:N-6 DNA methylase [Fibrobacterota bacterium]
MASTTDIVARLWSLCNVLRDDGVTYQSYVTELTYLLFLKMAKETNTEGRIKSGYRWSDLKAQNEGDVLTFYKLLQIDLGNARDAQVSAIFANASTTIRQPKILKKLIEDIDALDWYSAGEEGLGDCYEGLLEKNASEKKSGAGQYFTPRPLIDSMVALMQPQPGEVIQDPASGTGGFLIAASRWMREKTDNYFGLSVDQQSFQKKHAFVGIELVQDTHRLLLMNALLHHVQGELHLGDALSPLGAKLPKADLILTNPPFGTKKGGGLPTRDDFTYPTANKQLAFLQHIYRNLRPGGRAAVVLPDNVLFADGDGVKIRRDLMHKCDLHTILRLPTGIFYAQGVKTNVLFFTRGKSDLDHTSETWVYDLRANMPAFGKRTPLERGHFAEFEKAYGKDPLGKSKRKDQGLEGRFRKFSRQEIFDRNDDLSISWLKDDSAVDPDNLPEPLVIADEILAKLRLAMTEMEAVRKELGE